jgi:hypothetical protein
MKSWSTVTLGVISVALFAAPALAEEAERPFAPHLEFGLGAGFALGVAGEHCTRVASDVVDCSSLSFIAFEVTPRWRLTPLFSLGVTGQLGRSDRSNMLRFGAEARYHPLGDSHEIDPSLGIDAGAVVMFDTVPRDEFGTAETFSNAAPSFGASAGLDFALGESVSLGVGARLALLAFGGNASPLSRRPSYSTQLIFSAGLVGTFRFGALSLDSHH